MHTKVTDEDTIVVNTTLPQNSVVDPDIQFLETAALLDDIRYGKLSIAEIIRRYTLLVLALHNGRKTRAARALAIDRRSIYRILQPTFKSRARGPKRVRE